MTTTSTISIPQILENIQKKPHIRTCLSTEGNGGLVFTEHILY